MYELLTDLTVAFGTVVPGLARFAHWALMRSLDNALTATFRHGDVRDIEDALMAVGVLLDDEEAASLRAEMGDPATYVLHRDSAAWNS
jgi:hypothetical protein